MIAQGGNLRSTEKMHELLTATANTVIRADMTLPDLAISTFRGERIKGAGSLGRSIRTSEIVRLGEKSVRGHFNSEVVGNIELHLLQNGLSFHLLDFVTSKPVEIKTWSQTIGASGFVIGCEGEGLNVPKLFSNLNVKSYPWAGFYHFGHGAFDRVTIAPHKPFRALYVMFPRTEVVNLWEEFEMCVPAEISRLGGGVSLEAIQMALTPELKLLAYECLNCRLEGKFRERYFHSKCHELLCLMLSQLKSQIERGAAPLTKMSPHQRVSLALEIMEENIAEPISVKEISEKVGVNQKTLNRDFMALLSSTLSDCYRNKRLEHSKQLLLETNLTIQEISLSVGYYQTSGFTNSFRDRYGITPSMFRHSSCRIHN